MHPALARFSAPTRDWFTGSFPAPTAAQAGAWDAISAGGHTLVVAPTGSGKTLSAFLWSIDQLLVTPRDPERPPGPRVLYISPLKALGVDVERNLRAPLTGIARSAARLGMDVPEITVGVRSGDTPSPERRRLQRTPPDVLITTPESLFLMLTSSAREILTSVETVIIDEIHAVAATKRGAHLAVSLERLDARLPTPAQRIGLSATVRPIEEVARFLGGRSPVSIVQPPAGKTFDLRVIVPVDDMTEIGPRSTEPLGGEGAPETGMAVAGSIWPHVDRAIVDEVLAHRSTIVFVNSRRLAERLTASMNEIYEEIATGTPAQQFPAQAVAASGITGAARLAQAVRTTEPLARAHHGSVSKEERAVIEDDLKSGRLRCVVATSSLELGLDMGAVDLVIQVETPPSVASGLQRIGRAGHQVGEISTGFFFPKHRADLLSTTVVSERMRAGLIEELAVPQNPLDILAQQTVAATALDTLDVEAWFEIVRRSAPFASLPRSAYESVLDLLAGRYPSDEFAELRPRVVWDRVAGTLTGRPGAQRLAVTSGGTIPDRGLFGVFLIGSEDGARRVGELDEEMVYETRVGDVIALGATSWKVEEITSDRVLVSPAFGQPGRVPFWKGDSLGRPAELGRAIGAFATDLTTPSPELRQRLADDGLDERAVDNLLRFVAEQKEATGVVPSDRTLVVERFRDELGDWRLILHSPYGAPVHTPWALAVSARIRDELGVDGNAMAGDDGIVVRLPETDAEPPGAELFHFEPGEIEEIVTREAGGSALFAARFRENAARALLLPKRDPGRRSPLWQQRQRSAHLLEVVRRYPDFPIVLETIRELLQDAYDLPALLEITEAIARRRIRVVEVETPVPSPFARSLLFGYVAAFMYEGDVPLAERRAAALALDPELLGELLGRAELRELLDPAVIEQTERELQRTDPPRHARDPEGIVDLLRGIGPLSRAELATRVTLTDSTATIDAILTELAASRRIIPVSIAGEERWAVIEDAARLRDALGVPPPVGIPSAFLEPVPDPLGDVIGRYARSHGPFAASEAAERFGLGVAVVTDTLRRLAEQHRVVEGGFRPERSGREWVDAEVLRRLRRRSLAALRSDVEPISHDAFGRFLPTWQHVGVPSASGANAPGLTGIDGVITVIEQLAGLPLPASAWESVILPTRVRDYAPAMLDELLASGEVVWSGHGELPGGDGWVALHLAEDAPLELPTPDPVEAGSLAARLLDALASGGAFLARQLASAVEAAEAVTDTDFARALWELAWSGHISADSFAPLRARLGGAAKARATPRGRGRTRYARARVASSLAVAAPPTVSGRWALLPATEEDPTARAAALAERLLARYGVVTRGSVLAEGATGGFSLVYRVLSSFEDAGRVRRGYFVSGLGAAQFAAALTVDRLRSLSSDAADAASREAPHAVALAATDPANPYGAALPWPEPPALGGPVEGETSSRSSHRPGRKAGALVVLVDGLLALYVEKGGRTVLDFLSPDDESGRQAAARALAATVRAARGRLRIDTINGSPAHSASLSAALLTAGFVPTPRGIQLRPDVGARTSHA